MRGWIRVGEATELASLVVHQPDDANLWSMAIN